MNSFKTYPYWIVLLLALDRFGAAIVFNRPDITISTLCWIVLYATQGDPIAVEALTILNLYGWQHWILKQIASGLEWMFPGHCIQSRATDLETSQSTINLLETK